MAKWFFIALTFCAAAAWSQDALSPTSQPARPLGSAESQVPALSVPTSATDQQIQRLQNRVKQVPADYAGYDELGAAFLQKARETGDIAYYDLAEQTLKRSLELVPQDFRAAQPLVHLGLVCMGEHRFSDALTYSQRALALGSGDLAAFALEGDTYTDMGDYDAAQAAYSALRSLGGATSPPLRLAYMLDSRLAYLSFLHGDSAKAIRLMNSAIAAALQTQQPPENLAWLYFELGERYFQAGDLANAEQSYGSGIASDPNHYRSLAGLAKVRAAQGRLDESIQLYQRSIGVIPFPVYVAELGDVYKKIGRLKEAQDQYDLVEYIGHLSKLNQVLANRELALFYSDHGIKLPEALEFAQTEFEVRHDVYTWDAMAWAFFKNGRFQEAAAAMKKALSLNTSDPMLLFHAGMIYHGQGDDSKAELFLRRALETNPHFDVFSADVASRTLDKIAGSRSHDLRSSNAHN